jgi:hypothetical protein
MGVVAYPLRVLCARACPERSRSGGIPRQRTQGFYPVWRNENSPKSLVYKDFMAKSLFLKDPEPDGPLSL